MKYKFLDLQDHSKVRHKKALSEEDELVSNFKKPNFPNYFFSASDFSFKACDDSSYFLFKSTNLQ